MNRCGKCGDRGEPTTFVIDWTVELICDTCVASFDWTGWKFDPVTNTYERSRVAA